MSVDENSKSPQLGVGVIICRNGKVLFGKRLAKHGNNTWSPPGGSLEFGETIFECAQREAMEETGLRLKNMRAGPFTEDFHSNEGVHLVTFQVIAEADGEPKAMEPDKFAKWEWVDWNNLPQPLFLPTANLKKQNFNPFE